MLILFALLATKRQQEIAANSKKKKAAHVASLPIKRESIAGMLKNS